MEQKNIVATIYLKNGMAVKNPKDYKEPCDAINLASRYNDSGVDKIFLIDLSDDENEHLTNIKTIRNINRSIDVKNAAGGNIKHHDDVKI